jgi:predicted nucleotidyltransferase component of viral defense system
VIPAAHITAWRAHAPWATDAQVEQDLVLSRALVELFKNADISETLAFRGGTALHKLFFTEPGRYSEDIDLVQTSAAPSGPMMRAIRASLDSWLGQPQADTGPLGTTLTYHFEGTLKPAQRMRLKVEVNTTEHFRVLKELRRTFSVKNPWFSGTAELPTYHLEELLGTKMRALYQRKKSRDLYDFWLAFGSHPIDDQSVLDCFVQYMDEDGLSVTRAQYEKNLANKLRSPAFLNDIAPLIRQGASYDALEAGRLVHARLVSKLKGHPWKGTGPGWQAPW